MKSFLQVFLIALFLGLSLNTKAQKLNYDTTHRPAKYAELVNKFKAETSAKKPIIFLGNSITAGTDWGKLLKLENSLNRGISGDITYGVVERLQEVIDRKPSSIFLLIGINDISRNIPDSLILQNYRKIISRIRQGSPKTQIYMYTLLPVNASFGKFKNHYGKDDRILYINDEIRKLKAKKVEILDLYPAFIDSENKLRAELTKDGLHLIPAGYEVWAKFLKDKGIFK